MAPRYVAPSINLKSFNCPRCGALAHQEWFDVWCKPIENDGSPSIVTHEWVTHVKSTHPPADDLLPEAMFRLFERLANGDVAIENRGDHAYCNNVLGNIFVSSCYSCHDISLWRHDALLFPLHQYEIEPNEDISRDIQIDFNEARAILDLSPRGAVALLRLCVQKLCVQLGKSGNNLNDDIASLVKDGLSVDVQRALDAVRVIGNESVHPGTMDLRDDRKTAATLFGLVNFIADDRITRPKKLAELYSALPPDKVAAIEKRDSTKQKSP